MDNGYSWLVLTGSFICYFFTIGTMKTFGILYAELLETYRSDAGSTAFIGAINIFVSAIIGPVAIFMSTTYSFRAVTFVGGIISSVGLCISAATSNTKLLFITYSVITGIGFGLAFSPSVTIVSFYFDKWKALANGIVVTASAVATLTVPFLYRILFDTYGLHGGFLVTGGLCLHICVAAITFRQPTCFQRNRMDEETYKNGNALSMWKHIAKYMKGLSSEFKDILKTRCFGLYSVAFSMALLGYAGNLVIIPPYLHSRGNSNSDVVKMFIPTGVADLVSRIAIGWILDQYNIKAEIMFITNMAIGGVFSIIFPFFNSVTVNYIYSVLVGLFPGSFASLMPLMIMSVLDLKSLPSAFALATILNNSVYLLGVPISGWLEDLTGRWNTSFYFLGIVLIFSAIFASIGSYIMHSNKNCSKEMDIINKTQTVPMIDNCNTRHLK